MNAQFIWHHFRELYGALLERLYVASLDRLKHRCRSQALLER